MFSLAESFMCPESGRAFPWEVTGSNARKQDRESIKGFRGGGGDQTRVGVCGWGERPS